MEETSSESEMHCSTGTMTFKECTFHKSITDRWHITTLTSTKRAEQWFQVKLLFHTLANLQLLLQAQANLSVQLAKICIF
jgi:hypothetical protein